MQKPNSLKTIKNVRIFNLDASLNTTGPQAEWFFAPTYTDETTKSEWWSAFSAGLQNGVKPVQATTDEFVKIMNDDRIPLNSHLVQNLQINWFVNE